MKDVTKENFEISGPVQNERQKLDIMSKTLGIDSKNTNDEDLRKNYLYQACPNRRPN